MLQRFGLYRIKYVEGNQLLCGEVRNIESPLWWADLDWTPSASQAALSLSSSAGQQRKKIRWKKLMGQDKGSLIKQKQRLCVDAKENKRLIAYSHQQAMSSYFLGRTASVHVAISPEGKRIMMNVPRLLLALSFTAEQMSYVMEYPIDQFESVVHAVFPPKILPTPQPAGEEGMLERQPGCCGSSAQQ